LLELSNRNDIFDLLYITLDDNAEFGLNRREEEVLRKLVAQYGLDDQVYIYPGTDEAALTMLAQYAAAAQDCCPRIKVIYQNETTKHYIPAYEGQPLAHSVQAQIAAAGAKLVEKNPDIILLINNCSDVPQREAWDQKQSKPYDFTMFEQYLEFKGPIGFVDLRYTNGADLDFYHWVLNQPRPLERFAYAGWNANSNSLGTVVSNAILLKLFGKERENAFFNLLRLIDDACYQSRIRTELRRRITEFGGNPLYVTSHEDFCKKFVFEHLTHALDELQKQYGLSWQLENVYFPWNRTYNIGMTLVRNDVEKLESR